ncbi:MAG: hypothetical protein QF915_05995 [Candidatus Woesearchaeota archaeon]|jgi:hypothetical protein|nr:hypothetical protein [Candidatus Woesearchaeota archaeon]MDP7457964.1 hypothetical protein [Candidatus Woesearchaeota archaeon]|tara:strand:- start:801 stop:1010 length:210 start_codon:yes stop_codon:yes gene_type:complete
MSETILDKNVKIAIVIVVLAIVILLLYSFSTSENEPLVGQAYKQVDPPSEQPVDPLGFDPTTYIEDSGQ